MKDLLQFCGCTLLLLGLALALGGLGNAAIAVGVAGVFALAGAEFVGGRWWL